MTAAPIQPSSTHSTTARASWLPAVTWEPLPEGVHLPNNPVDNTRQPLLAGSLRESLALAGLIQPHMLIATNFGLCTIPNGYWLRWWDADGNLLPWAVERLAQEQQKLEQEHQQRAEQAEQQHQQLLDQLRNSDSAQLQALGIQLE